MAHGLPIGKRRECGLEENAQLRNLSPAAAGKLSRQSIAQQKPPCCLLERTRDFLLLKFEIPISKFEVQPTDADGIWKFSISEL